jgi:hypothetical protein
MDERNDWLEYRDVGMPYVVLSSNETTTRQKLRVWIQGGADHGEAAADESILAFLGALDDEPTWALSLLNHLDVLVVPRPSPNAIYWYPSVMAQSRDPHPVSHDEHLMDMQSMYNHFDPHLTIDVHEFQGSQPYHKHYVSAADVKVCYAKHPLVHEHIRKLADFNFTTNLFSDLTANGLRVDMYTTVVDAGSPGPRIQGCTPRSRGQAWSARGLRQSLSFLLEVRGFRQSDTCYQRRVAASFLSLCSFVQTAATLRGHILSVLDSAVADFQNSTDDMVITYEPTKSAGYFRLLDSLSAIVDTNINLPEIPHTYRDSVMFVEKLDYLSTANLRAKFTRSRPKGYIIPRFLAPLVQELKNLGVEVHEMTSSQQMVVESMRSTDFAVRLRQDYFNRGLLVDATMEMTRENKTIPAGSFYIDASQKNAALAIVALEPESQDSFIAHDVIRLGGLDEEYPIFRVPRP